MDIALAIEHILLAAEYFGCTDKNTQEQYEKEINWKDKRISKPTWQEIKASWDEIKDLPNYGIEIEPTELELLQDKYDDLKSRLKSIEDKEAIK